MDPRPSRCGCYARLAAGRARAQQHGRLKRGSRRAKHLVRYEAAIAEGPQHLIEDPELLGVSVPHEHALRGEVGLLRELARKLQACGSGWLLEHVEVDSGT